MITVNRNIGIVIIVWRCRYVSSASDSVTCTVGLIFRLSLVLVMVRLGLVRVSVNQPRNQDDTSNTLQKNKEQIDD